MIFLNHTRELDIPLAILKRHNTQKAISGWTEINALPANAVRIWILKKPLRFGETRITQCGKSAVQMCDVPGVYRCFPAQGVCGLAFTAWAGWGIGSPGAVSLLTKPRPALGAGLSYRITTPPVRSTPLWGIRPVSFLGSERPCPSEWQTFHLIEIHPLSSRWDHVCACMCTCAYTCVRVPAHAHRISVSSRSLPPAPVTPTPLLTARTALNPPAGWAGRRGAGRHRSDDAVRTRLRGPPSVTARCWPFSWTALCGPPVSSLRVDDALAACTPGAGARALRGRSFLTRLGGGARRPGNLGAAQRLLLSTLLGGSVASVSVTQTAGSQPRFLYKRLSPLCSRAEATFLQAKRAGGARSQAPVWRSSSLSGSRAHVCAGVVYLQIWEV